MADRVFFVAGSPESLTRGVAVPQRMISDLLEISRLPLGILEQAGIAVSEATGFLDDARLDKLIGELIPEKTAAEAVVGALRNLRPTAVPRTLKALEEWRDAAPHNRDQFSDEALASVRLALATLIRPSAALDRQRKARRLDTLTGHLYRSAVASRTEKGRACATANERAEWEFAYPASRCGAVVEALQRADLSREERRDLILEAEVLPYRGGEAAAITPLLRRFIEESRGSNVHDDQVAVGSAIRNYVATAAVGDALEYAADLLKADGAIPLSIELEIEVAKMVVRKLTANPPGERGHYAELALRLEEIVEAYARPRLLAREKYGAVALNAVLGLILTRSGSDARAVAMMGSLDVAWFQRTVARRAERLRGELLARFPIERFADLMQNLARLGDVDSSTVDS